MMKRLKVILLLAGICFLSACSSSLSYPEAIREAERCILRHPDSALLYLSSLDTSIKHQPEEVQMHHALLTMKAKDKLYITHTSDSVIKEIVQFYESYGDADKLMEAYHYLGSAYRDMEDAPQAITAFQQAANVGKESDRYDILGRIYEQMGGLFAYQGMYDDAIGACRSSYDYYLKQNEEAGIAIALRDIARMYNATNREDSATYYYEKAYAKAVILTNTLTKNYILSEIGCFYADLDKTELAKSILLEVTKNNRIATALLGLGQIYANTFQRDSAKFYFNEALECNNRYVKKSAYQELSNIEVSEGDYPKALDYANKSLEQADSIKQITKTEAVSKIHSLYNYQHTEKKNQSLVKENERKKILLYQLILFLVIVIIVAWSMMHYSKKRSRMVLEQEKKLSQLKADQYANSLDLIDKNKLEIDVLEKSLQQVESQNNLLRKQLIQSQKELLEISNQKILASQNEKELLELSFKKSDIYLCFHESKNNKKEAITEKEWAELRIAIDTTYPHFTSRLYSLYPQLSELELRICYLIKIAMQVKDIALLLNRSASAITASRIRLYKKIHGVEGNTDVMDLFIHDL